MADTEKEIKRLKRKCNRLRNAVRFALGEIGNFGEMPQPEPGKPARRYWWRDQLKRRAGELKREA